MVNNLELEYFHPSDPFPLEWVNMVSTGETAMMEQTLQWLADQSFGALSFPFKPKKESIDEWMTSRKKQKRHYIIASIRNGKALTPVGFVDIEFRLTRLHSYTTEVIPNGFPAVAYINAFYTDPQYRNLGIGTSLLTEAEVVARKAKCKILTLTFNTRNTAASKFYHRRKFTHLETQFYGIIHKPRNVGNTFVQPIPFSDLKKNKSIFFELKGHVAKDSKGFYPLFGEVEAAAKALQNNTTVVGLQFNGGRDGYALTKPILRDAITSVYPLMLAPQIWTDSTKLKRYMYAVGQFSKTTHGTEVLHTCSMDLGSVHILESIGFSAISEVLRKQI